MSHLDLQWEDPEFRRACERFASYARLLSFDRRGTGLSDPLDRAPTLDQQMDDLDVVLEAAGMERVALFGAGEAGLCAIVAFQSQPLPLSRSGSAGAVGYRAGR